MRWSGSLRVSYAVVPITPNNGIAADQTVVEWPCLLAVCTPRAENVEVYFRKHGQRRLLLWGAAVGAGRCKFFAALVCGSRCPGIARRVRLLFLSRSGACDSHGTWGGGVSRRRPRRGGHG